MAKDKRAESHADFEFVRGRGIHPFYLAMSIDEVLEAATGWKITSTERDDGPVAQHIVFSKKGRQIDVGALDVCASVPNMKSHYQVYWIGSYDAVLSNGRKISAMTRKQVLKKVLVEFRLSSEDIESGADIHDNAVAFITPDDVNGVLFGEYERHRLRVSEVPPLGDD